MIMNILVPLTYKDVFGKQTPKGYFDFISKYPKNQLMARLSYLGNQATGYMEGIIKDNSVSTHLKFLEIFELPDLILEAIANCLEDFKGACRAAWSRDSVLYGMEEILKSDLEDGETNCSVDPEFKTDVFCYLLCINDIYFKSGVLANDFTVEEFNASILPVNNIPQYNPITCCIKGVRLINYLLEDTKYSVLLKEYIKREYHCTVAHYIGFFLRWGLGSTNIIIAADQVEFAIFKKLSEPKAFETEIRKLSSIRVSPVYHVGLNNFVVLDRSFLMGKIYYQFIYELWFSCVKLNTSIKADTYFGKIGKFFEQYSAELLKRLFSFTKHPAPLCLSELDYKTAKGGVEFADFYARENRKLVFAEIKMGNLNDNERYSGNINGLYAKGKTDFFDSLRQLDDSIKNLFILKNIFDPKLETDKKLTIYPVCILNDKIYDFAMMKITFSQKWEEKRGQFPNLIVKPLVILQIEELEGLVYKLELNHKKKDIWEVFNAYCRVKKEGRAFSLARLDSLKLDYPSEIRKELQGYMDVYKI
jgi:hypothetical protein